MKKNSYHFFPFKILYTHMCICVYMKRMDFVIDDELADEFRALAYEKGNYLKGSLSNALEDALEIWINKNQQSHLSRGFRNRKRRKARG